MRPSLRKTIATLAVAGLSFTAAPLAFAEEPTVQKPLVLVEPENPAPGFFGPFCGHHEKIKPLPLPTEASFLMSDGTAKVFPVTLFTMEKPEGSPTLVPVVINQEKWEEIMYDPILDPGAWGDGVTDTVWVQINDREDTSFRKEDALQYQYRFERLIPWGQDGVNVETPVGTAPQLPAQIDIYIENEGMTYPQFQDYDPRSCANPTAEGWRTVDVVWDEISPEDLKAPGTFTVGGTITVDGVEWARIGGDGAWGEGEDGDYGFDALATVTVVEAPTTPTTSPATSTPAPSSSVEPTTEPPVTTTPVTSTPTESTSSTGTAEPTGTTEPSSTVGPVEPVDPEDPADPTDPTTSAAPGFDADSLILPGLILGSMALGSSGSSNGAAQPAPAPAPAPDPAPNADPNAPAKGIPSKGTPAKGAQPAQQQPKRTGTLANTGANSALTLTIASMLSVAGLTVLLAALRRRNA